MKFDLKTPYYKLIGLALLIYLLRFVDWERYLELVRNLKLLPFVLSCLVVFPQMMLKTLRWRELLADLGVPCRDGFYQLNLYYFAGLFFGIFTPGRLGDLIKFKFLETTDLKKAAAATFIDRLWDLLVTLLFGILSIIYTFGISARIILLSAGTGLLCVLILRILKFRAGNLTRFLPEALSGISMDYRAFLNPKRQCWIFAVTAVSICFFYFRMYIASIALGVELSLLQIFLVCSSVSVAVLLPVSVSGFGTREGTVMLYFARFKLSAAVAFAFSSLILALTLFDGLIGYLAYIAIPARNRE
ncbi:MAG: lysylphosphatidylglycerol synthase transmembrane domain-containing protein [Candidatus Wallbacteria bacterium]|nr:lysylphosphatidylglycerol synthase transmembrane domain-containing protein [Candidatus Wallbacteria bacterium]